MRAVLLSGRSDKSGAVERARRVDHYRAYASEKISSFVLAHLYASKGRAWVETRGGHRICR
jgi:hypothetical protein